MTWLEYALARQYITEIGAGHLLRLQKAREERLVERNREALRAQERQDGPRGNG